MALACGLEVGANVVKLAILEGGPRGARLVHSDVRKLDGGKNGEGPEADVVSAVKDMLKKRRGAIGSVVTSVRAQDAVVREIVVPFTRDDQIKKTIKFQAENYFHSTSIDDLVIEYLKFAEIEGSKSKLLVAGVKKAHIERKLRFLEECGLDPVAIDLDIAAMYNAYHFAGVFKDRSLVLCVEIEQDTLKIALVDEGKLRLARAIRIRTGSIRVDKRKQSERLSEEGDLSNEDSARLPVVILDDDEGFSLEDSGVSEAEREDYLGKIFLEIDRTVASATQRRSIDVICLTGASCALDAIEQIFTEHFEVPCERIDLSPALGIKDDKMAKGQVSVSLQLTTAVGLALKGLGVDAAGMDFRQEEFKFKGKFDSLKRGVACALCLTFALTFVFAFHLKQRLKERRNTLAGVKHLEEQVYTVLFPDLTASAEGQHKKEPVPGRWYEKLKYEHDRLESVFGGGSGGLQGGNTSALVVLKEFGAAKQRLGKDWNIEVTQIRIDPRDGQQSLFTFYAPGEQSGIALEQEFAKSTLAEGSNQNSHLDPQRNKWRFDFVVKLRKKSEGELTMAAPGNRDDFDVLKFFITVMALLTVIVGIFAGVIYRKVAGTTTEIKRELQTLHEMDSLAQNAPFRDWVAREREGKAQGTGTAADFKALVSDRAQKCLLHVKDTGEAGQIEHPGGTRELRFRIRVEGARVEHIMRFLATVETDWPGAKTREIPELVLDEKTGNTWNATLVLAIFKHAEQS